MKCRCRLSKSRASPPPPWKNSADDLTAFREAVLGISSWVRLTYGMDKARFVAGLIEMTRGLAKQEGVDFAAALELGMKWEIPDSL